MIISGFTIARNADKLYFPIEESIRSILPLVDEFIVALDPGDDNDHTLQIIEDIQSSKIKIIPRQWSEESFQESRILAEETNFALSQCRGDWCFYLQADEVIHEHDHQAIIAACKKHKNNPKVEGLLFDYNHFWGDYNHYLPFHGWYKNEIRIIKNGLGIQSIKDAQSFRKHGTEKLKVAKANAHVYHYGWVRPPRLMQNKKKIHDGLHRGVAQADKEYSCKSNNYDYGPLGRIPRFAGTHPQLMQNRINHLDWQAELNYSKNWIPSRPLNKHEKMKYRMLTWIEDTFFQNREIFGYSNWELIE